MFGKSKFGSTKFSNPKPLNLRQADLLLLSTFLCPRPDKPNYYLTSEAWEKVLGRSDSEATKALREAGLIRLASNLETVEAVATPQWLADLTAHFKMPASASAADVVARYVRVASQADIRKMCPAPLEVVTELGAKIATDFLRREEIFNFDRAYRSPPEGMIKGIKTFGGFLLTAVTAGIIGNRSDALFVNGVNAIGSPPASSMGSSKTDSSPVGGQAGPNASANRQGDKETQAATRQADLNARSSAGVHHDMPSLAPAASGAIPVASSDISASAPTSHQVVAGGASGNSMFERFFSWLASNWH